jgi:membrane-bound serine protease (ClpP class)
MFRFLKNRTLFFVGLISLSCAAILSLAQSSQSEQKPFVYFIQFNDDTVNPVTAQYISNAIDQAHADQAECLIIKLDTPGGLLSSTRTIVKKILAAKIPVIVYIAPSGAHAGSAGVFITYASHLAAMATSTNIGAAHPVQMGGEKPSKSTEGWGELRELIEELKMQKISETKSSGEEMSEGAHPLEPAEEETDVATIPVSEEIKTDEDPMSSKILNDTVAFIKSIAVERNRNVEWAIKSVIESDSITEREALEMKVIEIIADTDTDLLAQLNGRVISISGEERVLHTAGAQLRAIDMSPREKILNVLANPNITYMLMIIGFYALLFEVTHPGFGVPGILGAVFLILAFFSMQTLPINYAGLALFIVGILLLLGEVFLPGFGILTLGGTICMVLGSLFLFDSVDPVMRVSAPIIFAFTVTTLLFTLFLMRSILRVHRQKPSGGREGLVGEIGEARSDIVAGKVGKVFVHGELWNARSEEPIKMSDEIEIISIHGLELKVKRFERRS